MHKIFFTTLLSVALPLSTQAGSHGGKHEKNMEHKEHHEISEMHEGEGHDMENMSVMAIEKAIDSCLDDCISKEGMTEESCYEKHEGHIEKMRERIELLKENEYQELEDSVEEEEEEEGEDDEGFDDDDDEDFDDDDDDDEY